MSIADLEKKYAKLMHAMQSGVAMLMNYDKKETEPKHLRVGVNSALIDTGAILQLLINKGIITHEEFLEVLCEFAERDVRSYEDKLKQITGGNITLA